MIEIYQNSRCSKSREGLQILEEAGQEFKIVDYMKEKLSVNELKDLIQKLKIQPMDLVRKNESIWKENFKGKDLTEEEIIRAIAEFSNLIERPIVVKNGKAVIGRPPSLIKDIL